MADVDASLGLAVDFPPVARDSWLELAGDLDRLRTTTYDGITIEPLYTAADVTCDAGVPGFAPFVRGRTPNGNRAGWDIRQLVDVRRGHGAAVAELERGATSVWLRVGAQAVDDATLAWVLDGVLFDVAPIVLDAGPRWAEASRSLRVVWDSRGGDPAAICGSLGADPWGDWFTTRNHEVRDANLGALNEARALTSTHPKTRLATIDGSRFHNAGASDAQELGDTIATLVATLRTLSADGGLDVESALGALEVRLAATVDQFATIAKFRAMRLLVARVADIAGAPHAPGLVPLHAVTSRAMATRYDSAVNIVRATVACFAAATGGADAITVLPHDALVTPTGSELGQRLARNTQAVLELESNVAGVIDPAGGSWYIERLTDQVAERAWDVFQQIESAGGFGAAVEAGLVDDGIAATRRARRHDVDRRRALIVGVTAFPAADVPTRSNSPAEPPVDRWAAEFENLRERVDTVAASGRRPSMFLAALGSSARCARQLSAAANFFAIAGLDTAQSTADTDVQQIAEAFTASSATVAFACQGESGEPPDELREALATAGATRVYTVADLGGDAWEVLADLLERLQVP